MAEILKPSTNYLIKQGDVTIIFKTLPSFSRGFQVEKYIHIDKLLKQVHFHGSSHFTSKEPTENFIELNAIYLDVDGLIANYNFLKTVKHKSMVKEIFIKSTENLLEHYINHIKSTCYILKNYNYD